MATSKRNKTTMEKKYISQMWVLRNRYNVYKSEFDAFGVYQDGMMMCKIGKEINRLRVALRCERRCVAA